MREQWCGVEVKEGAVVWGRGEGGSSGVGWR